MPQFRKKPIVVTAVQVLEDNYFDLRELEDESARRNAQRTVRLYYVTDETGSISNHVHHVEVETPEGIMVANYGDWIIRGIKGEFYPCKPDIFFATYEPV